MTWTETHERYRIIREVVKAAETDPTGKLPWRDEYAEYFGNREGLVNALRSRWQHTCEAQLHSDMSEAELKEAHRTLLRTHAAVLRVLDNYRAVARAEGEAMSVAWVS
jgi:hypothetical protein